MNDVADKPHVLAARAIGLAEQQMFNRLSRACSSFRDHHDVRAKPVTLNLGAGVGHCRRSDNEHGLCLREFCPLLKDE